MFNCCLPPVSEIIGWQLCSEMSYPDPDSGLVFPLTAPLRVAVTLTKQDRGLQQYVVEAAYNYIAQVPLARWALAFGLVGYSGDSAKFQYCIFSPLDSKVYVIINSTPNIVGRYAEHKLLVLIVGIYSFCLRNSTHKQSVVSV